MHGPELRRQARGEPGRERAERRFADAVPAAQRRDPPRDRGVDGRRALAGPGGRRLVLPGAEHTREERAEHRVTSGPGRLPPSHHNPRCCSPGRRTDEPGIGREPRRWDDRGRSAAERRAADRCPDDPPAGRHRRHARRPGLPVDRLATLGGLTCRHEPGPDGIGSAPGGRRAGHATPHKERGRRPSRIAPALPARADRPDDRKLTTGHRLPATLDGWQRRTARRRGPSGRAPGARSVGRSLRQSLRRRTGHARSHRKRPRGAGPVRGGVLGHQAVPDVSGCGRRGAPGSSSSPCFTGDGHEGWPFRRWA